MDTRTLGYLVLVAVVVVGWLWYYWDQLVAAYRVAQSQREPGDEPSWYVDPGLPSVRAVQTGTRRHLSLQERTRRRVSEVRESQSGCDDAA